MSLIRNLFVVFCVVGALYVVAQLGRNYRATGDIWTRPPQAVTPVAAVAPAPSPAPAPTPVAAVVAPPASGPTWTFAGLALETVAMVVIVPLIVIVGAAGGGSRYVYGESQHITREGLLTGWTNTRVPVIDHTPTTMTNGMAGFIWLVCVVLYYAIAYGVLKGYPLIHFWTAVCNHL